MIILYVQWVFLMEYPRSVVVVVAVSRGLHSLGRWVTRVTSAENWAARVAAEGLPSIADFVKGGITHGDSQTTESVRIEDSDDLDSIDKSNGKLSIDQGVWSISDLATAIRLVCS